MNSEFAARNVAFVLLVGALLGCGGAETSSAGELTELATAGSPTPVFATPADDRATGVVVENGMSLRLHATLRLRAGDAGDELHLQGSTSRDLSFVQGFIPDDAFGAATQLGPRSFDLVFTEPSDIDTVVSGVPFFLELATHSASGDEAWSVKIVAAPRLVPAAGSSATARLALAPAITPTLVTTEPEGVVFRGLASTTERPGALTIDAAAPPTLVRDAPHAWHFDWAFGAFERAAAGRSLEADATFGAITSTRKASIEVRVAEVGLAAGQSADDIYGFPSCDPAVLACLRALPPWTTDFGACGAYLPVRVCLEQEGFPLP